MIGKPETLLERYGGFELIDVDYENVLAAYAEAPEVAGAIRLDVQAILDFGIDDNSLGQRELRAGSATVEKRCLRRGMYAHNIDYKQEFSSSSRKLLDCPTDNALPLHQVVLQHGDLIVVDAMVIRGHAVESPPGSDDTDPELLLADFPPFISKPSDHPVLLRMAPAVRKRILRHRFLTVGWNPYCRALVRYSSMGENSAVLDLLRLSARTPPRVPLQALAAVAKEAEGEEVRDAAFLSLVHREDLVKGSALDLSVSGNNYTDFANKAWRSVLTEHFGPYSHVVDIEKFEDNIFTGPMAFWLGLHFFRKACDATGNSPAQDSAVASIASEAAPFNETGWKESLSVLQALGVVRFDENALRALGIYK